MIQTDRARVADVMSALAPGAPVPAYATTLLTVPQMKMKLREYEALQDEAGEN